MIIVIVLIIILSFFLDIFFFMGETGDCEWEYKWRIVGKRYCNLHSH